MIRLQRKRTKGWRMPKGAIYVGRPTKWGNPYKVGDPGVSDRKEAVHRFRLWIDSTEAGRELANAARKELRGHDLVCWCQNGTSCHADVLIEIANS